MTGTVDYAGLFPPAALPMAEAAAAYAAAMSGPDAWMLGRFVVTAARLPELSSARASLSGASRQWLISAIVADGEESDFAAIAAFNAAAPQQAMVDAIECKPRSLAGIDWLAERAAGKFDVYVEVGADADPLEWLTRVAARGLRGKIRMGGTAASGFPLPATVLAFLDAALQSGVLFKATAGLHHAVRGDYRLTYEADAAVAPMYGYLNVLLATAALRDGRPIADAEQLLLRADASSLRFDETAVNWDDAAFSTSLLNGIRSQQLVSFGSCSFIEPATELRALLSSR